MEKRKKWPRDIIDKIRSLKKEIEETEELIKEFDDKEESAKERHAEEIDVMGGSQAEIEGYTAMRHLLELQTIWILQTQANLNLTNRKFELYVCEQRVKEFKRERQ